MRHVKMRVSCLIGSTVCRPGDVLELDDLRAAQLVQLGHAEHCVVLAAQEAEPAIVGREVPKAVAPAAPAKAVTRK